jgi:hypothetical protein
MAARSPTLEGFRAVLKHPSLVLAEIAWRWSLGAAGLTLITFAFIEYLDTLPVTRGDLVLLRSSQPALISQAFLHILKGSGFRVVEAVVVLAVASAIAWIVVSGLGRAATLRALLGYFRESDPPAPETEPPAREVAHWQLRSLLGLNFLRVAVTLAAAVGGLAAFLAGGAVSPDSDPAPGSAFFVTACVILLVWLTWSTLNWFLSLASVFVVADGHDTFGAMWAAIELGRKRSGAIFAVGTWFGLAHIVAFVIVTTAVAFPLSLGAVLPAGVTFGGVLLVTLLYLAAADFLYVGRLAGYVAILKLPPAAKRVAPEFPGQPPSPVNPQSDRVDPDELILGDLPATT